MRLLLSLLILHTVAALLTIATASLADGSSAAIDSVLTERLRDGFEGRGVEWLVDEFGRALDRCGQAEETCVALASYGDLARQDLPGFDTGTCLDIVARRACSGDVASLRGLEYLWEALFPINPRQVVAYWHKWISGSRLDRLAASCEESDEAGEKRLAVLALWLYASRGRMGLAVDVDMGEPTAQQRLLERAADVGLDPGPLLPHLARVEDAGRRNWDRMTGTVPRRLISRYVPGADAETQTVEEAARRREEAARRRVDEANSAKPHRPEDMPASLLRDLRHKPIEEWPRDLLEWGPRPHETEREYWVTPEAMAGRAAASRWFEAQGAPPLAW